MTREDYEDSWKAIKAVIEDITGLMVSWHGYDRGQYSVQVYYMSDSDGIERGYVAFDIQEIMESKSLPAFISCIKDRCKELMPSGTL
jgi:hypothetical protein